MNNMFCLLEEEYLTDGKQIFSLKIQPAHTERIKMFIYLTGSPHLYLMADRLYKVLSIVGKTGCNVLFNDWVQLRLTKTAFFQIKQQTETTAINKWFKKTKHSYSDLFISF